MHACTPMQARARRELAASLPRAHRPLRSERRPLPSSPSAKLARPSSRSEDPLASPAHTTTSAAVAVAAAAPATAAAAAAAAAATAAHSRSRHRRPQLPTAAAAPNLRRCPCALASRARRCPACATACASPTTFRVVSTRTSFYPTSARASPALEPGVVYAYMHRAKVLTTARCHQPSGGEAAHRELRTLSSPRAPPHVLQVRGPADMEAAGGARVGAHG